MTYLTRCETGPKSWPKSGLNAEDTLAGVGGRDMLEGAAAGHSEVVLESLRSQGDAWVVEVAHSIQEGAQRLGLARCSIQEGGH